MPIVTNAKGAVVLDIYHNTITSKMVFVLSVVAKVLFCMNKSIHFYKEHVYDRKRTKDSN